MIETKKDRKRKKKILLISIIVILILIIISAVIISSGKEKIITVQTEKVALRNITETVSGTGFIQPEKKVDISAEISGEIVQLPFREGDKVKKGDLIVKIKAEQYSERISQQRAGINYSQSQVEVAENNLRKAEIELKRIEQLHTSGLVSDADLDNAKIAYDVAVSQLKSAKANVSQNYALLRQSAQDLSKATIRAPIDGTITKLNNELGEKVVGTQQMAGSVIMTISDLSVMNAEIEVSETEVTNIKLGDSADIEVDAFPDRIIKGYVYEISNSAKSKGMGTQEQIINFIVKIRIVDQDVQLKPGMSCNADIRVKSKQNVISVPIQSVTARDEDEITPENEEESVMRDYEKTRKKSKPKEIVFVVKQENPPKVSIKEVKTGISDDRYIEITEGLQVDEIVVKGPYKAISKELEEGSKVKIDNEVKKKNKNE
ncbi:MAG: efflux RND transporter periplasmic adaptor subunit [Ignavibacteria bacterium]|nr:efflux RND transporter periplasmic adaptor subunit [Ignavibacteria bacterium]